MKKITLLLLLLIQIFAFDGYSQVPTVNTGFTDLYYYNRLLGARYQALGKQGVTLGGDIFSTTFNPAGLSELQGMQVDIGYSKPVGPYDSASTTFVGFASKINNKITMGGYRSILQINNSVLTDYNNQKVLAASPSITNYCYTLAVRALPTFSFGLNLNFFSWKFLDLAPTNVAVFDFGFIKYYFLQSERRLTQKVTLAGSITNFTFSRIQTTSQKINVEEDIPTLARFGVNYQYGFYQNVWSSKLMTFNWIVTAEVQTMLNSDYHKAARIGTELQFFECLSLRAGYNYETLKDPMVMDTMKVNLSDISFGIGINIPLDKFKFMDRPITIKFDGVYLPQEYYFVGKSPYKNYYNFNFSIIYRFAE